MAVIGDEMDDHEFLASGNENLRNFDSIFEMHVVSSPFWEKDSKDIVLKSAVSILVALVPHLFISLEYSRFIDPQRGQNVDRVGCPNCHRTYKSRKHLFQHLRSGTGCDKPKLGDCLPADGLPLAIYQCSSCSYVTYVKGFLHKHLRLEHDIQNPI